MYGYSQNFHFLPTMQVHMHLDVSRSKTMCLISQHEMKEEKRGQGFYWTNGNWQFQWEFQEQPFSGPTVRDVHVDMCE
jgi:hypothetical protein